METGFTVFWQGVKELFFPAACLACGHRLDSNRRWDDILFCPACAADIWLLDGPLCRLCGKPFPDAAGGNHLCSICLQQPWHFSKARAVAVYKGPLITAIHTFKYRGQTAGLSSFVRLKERLDHLAAMEPDLIAPVPLHKRNLRQRGFNQALLLARAFFPDRCHKITTDLLERHRWTQSQAGLSGQLRRRNIKGAFRVQGPARVAGRTVLLVDDVFTTGATVNECARVLHGAGAIDVQVLTFCRVEE